MLEKTKCRMKKYFYDTLKVGLPRSHALTTRVFNSREQVNVPWGFTLVELILVIAVITILAAAGAPFYSRFVADNSLQTSTSKLLSTIRKAQSYAIEGKDNAVWGFCMSGVNLRLFEGSCATPTYKEDFDFSQVTVNGLTGVTFSGLTGKRGEPSASQNITISNYTGSANVTLDNAGGLSAVSQLGPPSTPTNTPTPLPTNTPTPSPAVSVTPTPTLPPTPIEFFKVGSGYSGFIDVIPHQIVRTNTDKVYIFGAGAIATTAINVYWTTAAGMPTKTANFNGSTVYNATAYPISVETAYDGGNIIHVLANLMDGTLHDYPFDITTNTFKSDHTISTGNPIGPYFTNYPGTSGVSAMVDVGGRLNVAYWSSGNHITYSLYNYDPATDFLVLDSLPDQVDTAGFASHPVLAISPLDGSVTVAWLSEAVTPHQVLGRTSTGTVWGNIEQISNPAVKVWTYVDPYGGLSVDQGPSLVITSDGIKHLAYGEDTDGSGNYGHVHYVKYTASTGWVDTALSLGGVPFYTHDAALVPDWNNNIYIFGHGLYLDASPCLSNNNLCYAKMSSGVWGAPANFATAPSGETFDASVSPKWGVVGWNRPNTIEVAFFSGQNSNYWNMTMYYGTLGSP